MFAQDGDEIVVRVALVQEHGLAGGGRDLELPAEGAALQIARREVPEIVEPAFADGDDVGFARQRLQRGQGVDGEVGGVMRMHAGGGEQHAGMRARELDRLARAFLARAGHDDLRDAGGRGALQDGVAVGVEAVVREIGADVDQFHGSELEDPALAMADQQTTKINADAAERRTASDAARGSTNC